MKLETSFSDFTGLETLEVIGKADKFNEWMYSQIAPFCKGEILEIGSGTGNISAFFLQKGASIYLSDIQDEYCKILSNRFSNFPNFKGITQIDLADSSFQDTYSRYLNQFDTVFTLNVLEHIGNDADAIKNCNSLLKPGGKLIILVPAYPFLYCKFDKELGHFRRYTKQNLKSLLENSGNIPEKIFRFNMAGIAGWLLFGKILGRKQIEQKEMSTFNHLVQIFKILDKITFHQLGLSIIAVSTKPNS